LKRRLIVPSPTSAYTATTPKSKSSKSPRRDFSVAFAARPAYELAFVRAAHDLSVHDARVGVKSARAPMLRAVRSRARRGQNLNHVGSARRLRLVVNLKAP
jgi:hypothetical protein